jgi:hypothetical protein
LNGNKCLQVFANKGFFAVAYPMQLKADAGKALKSFNNEYDIPEMLTFDNSKEQSGASTEFMGTVNKV